MKIGIDIHGVLDRHPKKYIELATKMLESKNNEVHIITGPCKEKAEQELSFIAKQYNNGKKFWSEVHSIVDWVKDNNIPHYYKEDGHLWTEDEEEWNMTKGIIAAAYQIDLHFDDTLKYKKYFDPGVFVHIERIGESVLNFNKEE